MLITAINPGMIPGSFPIVSKTKKLGTSIRAIQVSISTQLASKM